MRNGIPLYKLKKNGRAVSPAISTVILTSAVVVLLLVTITFANSFLTARMAENEFSAMKQFMETVGLQIDDVAWTIGRTQTISYASKFGQVSFEREVLVYKVYVDKPGEGYVYFANYKVGVLLFNMPISKYSLGNNYYEPVFPSDRSFIKNGTSAPVSHVYVIEKLPMGDGSFIRVVVVPSIRMLKSTISMGVEQKNYFKFYLPVLSNGTHPRRSQSITLFASTLSVKTESCNAVKINVTFPKAYLEFDNDFFRFENEEEIVDVPDGSIVEFYTGEVVVSLGLHA